MYDKKKLSIGRLQLDLKNYRHGVQPNQKTALRAIIEDQGKKLAKLAADIIEVGVSPIDLTLVVNESGEDENYTVVEGNRRLSTIRLLLEPDLAKGTSVHKAFVSLNKKNLDAIPKVLDCVIAPNRKTARTWIDRKHASGMDGVGTESWSAMAKARADADAGIARPELDVVNFVLSDPKLDSDLRNHLSGSDFQLSTLQRLIASKDLHDAAGFSVDNGKLVATANQSWAKKVLTDIVMTIKTGERKGEPFTVRTIDLVDARKKFAQSVVGDHSGRGKVVKQWVVTGKPINATSTASTSTKPTRGTPSTAQRIRLMPGDFNLKLPAGKINDIFKELRGLHVYNHKHSVSVLFRVFLEISLTEYIEKHEVKLPAVGGGRLNTLKERLAAVVEHVGRTKLMTKNQLQPIRTAISDSGSVLAPETLNAYVHGKWMHPDPEQLKTAWNNVQLFVERMWTSEPPK